MPDPIISPTARELLGSQADPQSPPREGKRKLSRKMRVFFVGMTLSLCSAVLAMSLELLLRLIAPQPLLPRYVTDSGFGIRVHCPSISIHHTTPEYRIGIRTNSMGIRADREFAFPKPEGVFRIVGLGDSNTFGYGNEVEDTYLARLEHLLREKGIDTEVINLGVAGHGTAEQLIMLTEMGLKFDPDLVILGYYPNDIGDNTRSKLYVLNDQGELVRNRKEYLPATGVRDLLYSFAAYRYLAERSHLLYFVRRNLSEIVQKELRQKHVAAKALTNEDEARLTAAILDEVKRTCMERNIAFCLLNIPASYNLEGNLPREFLAEITREEIVDVRETIKQRVTVDKLYWARSDGHWTPAGHEIAARALAKRIAVLWSDLKGDAEN